MCGGEEAISDAVTTWPELLVAQLCHMYPTLPLQSSLIILLDKCLQEKGASDDLSCSTLQQLLSVNKHSSWLLCFCRRLRILETIDVPLSQSKNLKGKKKKKTQNETQNKLLFEWIEDTPTTRIHKLPAMLATA
jgi:hypothetical protein